MPLVQVVCNVLIHLVNVPAMLAIREQNVMLLVVVILLVQVVQHVMPQQANVLAILVTKALIVMLLVVVILLVQAVQHVMLLLVNALAILDTQEPHVIPVPPTTTEQVEELVQVHIIL